MSERIVPTRFGLKYSPKPVIAIEYHRAAPNSGLATMKVTIEKLKPATHDVQGVVDALQKKYPRHLGSDVVNILQLKRLVTHLLVDGRPNLPEAYLSLPEPTFDEPPKPPLQKARRGKKPLSISEILGLSSGPTPAPTPEAPRLTHAQLDAAVHGSGSHRPGGTDRLDGAGAASAEGKRNEEGRSLAAEGRSVAAEQRQLAPEEQSVATFSAALERVRLSSPKEIFAPPPPQQRNNTSDDAEQSQEEQKKRDFSRKLEHYFLEGFPRGGAVRLDLRDTTTTVDETQGPSVKIEKTVPVAEDDDGCNDDGRSDEGCGMDDIDGKGTIDRALPTPAGGTLDVDATVDEATGQGRLESRQKKDGSGEEEEQEEEEDKKRREEKGAEEREEEEKEEKEGEEEEEEEEKDEVTEMLEILDDTESTEGEGADTLEASGEQKEEEVGTGETVAEPARGEDRNTTPYVSNTAAAAAAEDAAIATTAPGRVGNVSGTPDTLRQRTEVLEVTSQAENDDNAHKPSLQMEQPTLPSATRGTIGRTEDEMIADIKIPVPEDQAAAATPSASSSSPPLPTPLAAILAPPRSLSPPSPLLETGASSASSLSASSLGASALGASALGGGLPLPPVGGGRPRFGLLGSLPPVGGRGLPSLSLRSGAGLGEEAKTVDSISVAASAFPGANRSGDISAPPPPPPPPLGVFGSSAGGAEESLPLDGTPISRVAPRAFTGSAGSTRSSSILGDAPSGSRDGGVARESLRPDGSESQGGDEEGSASEASAELPASPRQHQGQEEEAAGVGVESTAGAPGSGRDTTAAGGEKAQGEGGAGNREASGGGYFSDSGGEISEEEIPEEVSSDDDISFEQDSSDGGGGGTGEGGNDDYFS